MPLAKFVTVVKCATANTQEKASASAGRYLAYGDTTNQFGERGRIDETDTHLENGDYHVTIEWGVPVAHEDEIDQINREMNRLTHVTKHECVTNPTIA